MKKILVAVLAMAALVALAPQAQAQYAQWDPSFYPAQQQPCQPVTGLTAKLWGSRPPQGTPYGCYYPAQRTYQQPGTPTPWYYYNPQPQAQGCPPPGCPQDTVTYIERPKQAPPTTIYQRTCWSSIPGECERILRENPDVAAKLSAPPPNATSATPTVPSAPPSGCANCVGESPAELPLPPK